MRWVAIAMFCAVAGGAAAQTPDDCAKLLSTACAERLGAGALAVGEDCPSELQAYRVCIQTVVASAAPSGSSLSCSNDSIERMWPATQAAHECALYAAFAAACPDTAEARFASTAMDRLNCAAATPIPGRATTAASATTATTPSRATTTPQNPAAARRPQAGPAPSARPWRREELRLRDGASGPVRACGGAVSLSARMPYDASSGAFGPLEVTPPGQPPTVVDAYPFSLTPNCRLVQAERLPISTREHRLFLTFEHR